MEQIQENDVDVWEKLQYMLSVSVRASFIPTPGNFRRLAEEIQGSKWLARIWFFASILIGQLYYYVYAFLFYYVNSNDDFLSGNSTSELGYTDQHIILGIILFSFICGGPFIALIRTLIFSLRIWVQNWLANLMKGYGKIEPLILLNAGAAAPLQIIKRLLYLLPLMDLSEPIFFLIIAFIDLIINLYQYVLSFIALRAVKIIHWGKAVLIVSIDLIVTIIVYAAILIPLLFFLIETFD